MERRLAAILVADLVGYSRLIGINEEGTLAGLKSLRTGTIEPLVAEYRGRIVKLMGDGFLVEFKSAVDAVNCAIAWQSRLDEQIDQTSLTFRIGVNVGDIVIEGDDILGDGVNVAARLESSGVPGYVLISDAVHHQIKGKIEYIFHDNGTIKLKNIAQPVRVWSWPMPLEQLATFTQAGERPSVYVAQFKCRGQDAEELSDAIYDDLITAFARQSGIRLITDPNEADFILHGTVRGREGHWRVSTNLIDRSNDQMVWSERFDEAGDDFFEIQDRFVTRLSGAVRIRLPSIVFGNLGETPLQEMNNQNLLNLAMNCHFVPTLDSWEKAVPALNLVLERESENWMAMTMRCFNLFTKLRIFGWRRLAETDAEFARELIEKAHTLKPDSEVVRMVHGAFCFNVERDINAARIEAEESLRLNSNYYHSIDLMSQIELFSGNITKAIDYASRAVECDPGYPYLHLYQRSLGYVNLVAGNYAAGAEIFQRADHNAPRLPQNIIGIIACAQLGSDQVQSQSAVKSLLEVVPEFNLEEYEPWPFTEPTKWAAVHEALAKAISR